jgi:hypothetical protein
MRSGGKEPDRGHAIDEAAAPPPAEIVAGVAPPAAPMSGGI